MRISATMNVIKDMTPSIIALAMSGGVDSSVAAALLKREGFEVRGFFLLLAQPDSDTHVQRVRAIASLLGIPLEIIDLNRFFAEVVLDYFAQTYFRGKTPNPCMICNPVVKFGVLLDLVMEKGHSFLATGHYARIVQGDDGLRIEKAKDQRKDQSYFLSQLGQRQLAKIRFPLGDITKDEVRNLARDFGLADLVGAESQDVCFLKGRNVEGFLRDRLAGKILSGPVQTLSGKTIGSHQGIHAFTIGQRRGLGLPDATPYYVLALDPLEHRVIVGKKEDLWQTGLMVGKVNWVGGKEPPLPMRLAVRIRYRHAEALALVEKGSGDVLAVTFDEPQLAITPGQFAVFYQDKTMLGGGEIDKGLGL